MSGADDRREAEIRTIIAGRTQYDEWRMIDDKARNGEEWLLSARRGEPMERRRDRAGAGPMIWLRLAWRLIFIEKCRRCRLTHAEAADMDCCDFARGKERGDG